MQRALITGFIVALCAKAPPPKPKDTPPPDPKSQVKALVEHAYKQFENGEVEDWTASFSDNCVVFGPSANDAYAGREALTAGARQALIPIGLSGRRVHLAESKPLVAVSKEGTTGWVADFPVAEIIDDAGTVKGRYAFRFTAHAVNEGGSWTFDAAQASVGFPNDDLYKASAQDKLGIPRALEDDRGAKAEPVVDLLRRMLKSLKTKIDRTSLRDEVVLIGTDPDEVFTGGKVFHEWAVKQLPAAEHADFTQETEGGIAARVDPSGQTAWVATEIVLTIGSGKKALTAPPFRALMIFEKGEKDWELVSDHQSVGVPPELWKKAPKKKAAEPSGAASADGGS